ncbi:MAG TPA: VOC family protein, partial [Chitinophagaceae bacterium]|nr:VOC family protein [Chitinophagaceae bacterium]
NTKVDIEKKRNYIYSRRYWYIHIITHNIKATMKKSLLLLLAISVSFLSGLAVKSALVYFEDTTTTVQPRKVTGIGGIFFKCKDPKAIREWYKNNLGFNVNPYGTVFEWRQGVDTTQKGFTQWSPFKETTSYFAPSTKDFMINYRVLNMETLVAELKKNGVTITDSIAVYDYGKFVHIMDPEGNKIELWEPNDEVYDEMGKKMNSPTTK